MKLTNYEVVGAHFQPGSERRTPKGKDIYYLCTKCNDAIPSQPDETGGCTCGNVFIDLEAFRLAVTDYRYFQVVRVH